MLPISSVTSFGKIWYPLGFSTSTSPASDILELVCGKVWAVVILEICAEQEVAGTVGKCDDMLGAI